MGWPKHRVSDDLTTVLEHLPEGYQVTAIGSAYLVVGGTGAQVVWLDDGQESAARALARLASVVRSALAEHMAWVPYVHTLLVTERRGPCPPATSVPLGLLSRALTEGPVTIQPDHLERLTRCIEAGVLNGLESVAPASVRYRLDA